MGLFTPGGQTLVGLGFGGCFVVVSRSQVSLQIPAVGCFKVSLVQAGLVCVLRKGSTLAGGELGIVTVTLCVLDQV